MSTLAASNLCPHWSVKSTSTLSPKTYLGTVPFKFYCQLKTMFALFPSKSMSALSPSNVYPQCSLNIYARFPSNLCSQCSLKAMPTPFAHIHVDKVTSVLSALFPSNLCPHRSPKMAVRNVHSNLNPHCSLQINYVHTVTSDLCPHCFLQMYARATPLKSKRTMFSQIFARFPSNL